MTLVERFRRIEGIKFSFGKSTEYAEKFARDCDAFSMYDSGLGLGISDRMAAGTQLAMVFPSVMQRGGKFLFNISGVDLNCASRGFSTYQEAEESGQITEWELFTIMANKEYRKSCIFHNGKVAFKKRSLWNSIRR